MRGNSAKQSFVDIIIAAGFKSNGSEYLRKADLIEQKIAIYADKSDGRKYIEYAIFNNDDLLVSGRADRAFSDIRYEIISSLSGEALDGSFDFTSWLTDEFLGMLDEMKSLGGVLNICRDQLDGKALISAAVRNSW
ncbi:hypothetical protein [Caulobacter sp. B11]|uniref:hypothetical protein n=1 Tax=Caulobacter sp. B11 TaxID=2048899 RepID=UPI00117D0130|nr:hypothetical protein [Caulobacter sp. B11]